MSQPVVGPAAPAPIAKGARIRIIRDQLKVADLTSDGGRPFTVCCDVVLLTPV